MHLYRLNAEQFEYVWGLVLAKLFSLGILHYWRAEGVSLVALKQKFKRAWVDGVMPKKLTRSSRTFWIVPKREGTTWLCILPPVDGEGSEREDSALLRSSESDLNAEIVHWCQQLFANFSICEHCRQKLGTSDPQKIAVKGGYDLGPAFPLQYAHAGCTETVLRERAPSDAEIRYSWTAMVEHPFHQPPST